MPRPRLLTLLALAAATGCAEDPSFSVRWQLGRSADDIATLTSVAQCTELGISRMRITTRKADSVIDEREFPCFPQGFDDVEAAAPGPEVGPGTYAVTVTALGHRGVPYTDPGAPPADEESGGESDEGDVIASAAREVTIRETGENQQLRDFAIVGPPECSDGVDNDRDGAADLADPSCRGSAAGSESGDLAAAQITVRPELLSGNPHATCAGLGLSTIKLALAGPTPLERSFECGTTPRTISEDLSGGAYTVTVSGHGFDGSERARPPLDPAQAMFELKASDFRTISLDADFTIASLLAGLSAGFSFSLEYEAAPDTLPVTTCTPGQGSLVIDNVEITLLDEAMAPITGAALYDGMMPLPLDGTPIPCTDLLKVRTVEPLLWDDQDGGRQAVSVMIEAFPAGSDTPCFGTDMPEPAAPNASFAILLRRLSTEGACAD
jgi:hypothetical protein